SPCEKSSGLFSWSSGGVRNSYATSRFGRGKSCLFFKHSGKQFKRVIMATDLAPVAGILKDALPVFTLVLGAWLGMHFNVLRDRRTERNEVVDRLRAHLFRLKSYGGPSPIEHAI